MLEAFIDFCLDNFIEQRVNNHELFDGLFPSEEGIRFGVGGFEVIFKLINKVHLYM